MTRFVLDLDGWELEGLIAEAVELKPIWQAIAAQIEGQLPKPKPVEPMGLAAVVVDTNGTKWISYRDPSDSLPHETPWGEYFGDEEFREYADIDVVKVLSEGVLS